MPKQNGTALRFRYTRWLCALGFHRWGHVDVMFGGFDCKRGCDRHSSTLANIARLEKELGL